MARIKMLDKAIVDDKTWYTLVCDREVESWIRALDTNCYKIIGVTTSGTLIDVREYIHVWYDQMELI